MTTSSATGIQLDDVYFISQQHEVAPPADDTPEESSAPTIGWDCRFLNVEDAESWTMEVLFTWEIGPSQKRPERIAVSVVGRFAISPEAEIAVERFAQYHAPGILFPYVREAVNALSARGPFDPIRLHPTNIVALTSRMSFEKTIAGQSLAEDPELRERIGKQASEVPAEDEPAG